MANIKTSKELTSELEKQKRLLDSIDESNRRYEATQRRIVTLQNQIAKARKMKLYDIISRSELQIS